MSEGPDAALVARTFEEFLRRTHLSGPADVPALVAEQARTFGADDVVLYLCDYEQAHLVPLPGPDTGERDSVAIEGTLHGRVFATSAIVQVEAAAPGRRRLVLPLLDGTERLGTLEMTVDVGVGGE